jgi:hypothetical protein
MSGDEFRRDVLAGFGAGGAETDELLRYGESGFQAPPGGLPARFPLTDEPFVSAWESYAQDAAERGVFPALRDRLVQLRFPVEAGIGATAAYRAATRQGVPPPEGAPGLELRSPDALRLFLHPTPAGRIPVLVAGDRGDFVALVRALTRRNEPEAVPDSMGACVVGGYNNWSRVAGLRDAWRALHPDAPEAAWSAAFREIVPRKELYQDRFVLLAVGPYSGVPAGDLGLDSGEWNADSLAIRLEHECAHYFCRRVWGSMRNSVLDELIADFVGISEAAGGFRAGWLLRFLGLEAFPAYREGARLQNYLGDPPLSPGAFRVLQRMVVAAARHLKAYSAGLDVRPGEMGWKVEALTTLPTLSLEAMAALPPERWTAEDHTAVLLEPR